MFDKPFSKQFLYRILIESLNSFENVCLPCVRSSLGKININYETNNIITGSCLLKSRFFSYISNFVFVMIIITFQNKSCMFYLFRGHKLLVLRRPILFLNLIQKMKKIKIFVDYE